MKGLTTILFIAIFIIPHFIFSQINTPDTLLAFYIDQKIKIDGTLNEKAWSSAQRISNFRQREMVEGALPTEKTEIAVLYDKNNLYIGFWGYDSESDKIVAKQMKRDFQWGEDDNFELILGTFNDKRNSFLFVVNPLGARADVLVGNEGSDFNKDWNGVWDVKTIVNENGWFAEIVIPFSTLSFQKKENQNWEINFERNIRRKKEQILWQGFLRKYELEKISQAGILTNLKGIKSKNNIEYKPYVTAGIEKSRNEDLIEVVKLGGEVNFNISPTMKLNITANTDFAQVEADDTKVNLSRFNLYFQEKRQFFLEGSRYFNFHTGHRDHLFYSRTIGIENEERVPILGGVKLYGKYGKNNIGLMSMQTGGIDAGDTREGLEIQSTNYSVFRLRRDIFRKSNIGFITTSKIRKDGRKNIVYGGDMNYSTTNFIGKNNLAIGLTIANSYTDSLAKNKALAYNSYIAFSNDKTEFVFSVTGNQKNYNPEMGFTRRSNYRSYFSILEFTPRFKSVEFIRNFIFIPFEFATYQNEETGDLESFWYEFTPLGFVTKSGDEVKLHYQRIYESIDETFEIFDTISVPVGKYGHNAFELDIEPFRGRRIIGELEFIYGGFYQGIKFSSEVEMGVNINKHLNILAKWDRNYIEFPNNNFVVSEFGGKVEYAFNPKLNSSVFGQWNNEDDEIILNYRLNWIPKIGSDFYFVINQIVDKEDGKYSLKSTTVLAKFVWRFVS